MLALQQTFRLKGFKNIKYNLLFVQRENFPSKTYFDFFHLNISLIEIVFLISNFGAILKNTTKSKNIDFTFTHRWF